MTDFSVIHLYDSRKIKRRVLEEKVCEYILTCTGELVAGVEPIYVSKTTTKWRGKDPTVATALWEKATCSPCLDVAHAQKKKELSELTARMKGL